MATDARTKLYLLGKNLILTNTQYIIIMKRTLLLILTTLLLFACGDDKGGNPTGGEEATGHGVFVCSEGNYGAGNATLTYYDVETGEAVQEAFMAANARPLGDVCQSMSIIAGKGYVVMNNSGKVVVIDPVTFEQTEVIDNLSSPRQILAHGDNLYINSADITVVDAANTETRSTIKLTADDTPVQISEGMLVAGDYLYVCDWSYGDRLFRIDLTTNVVVGTLKVTSQPNSIVRDANGKIWVLSDGGYEGSPAGQFHGALTRINPETFAIEKVMTLSDINSSPSKLCIGADGRTLYFINSNWMGGTEDSGIYAVDIDAETLPASAFIPSDGKSIYGLGVDPYNSDIYVTDALDYQQPGMVYHYSSAGTLTDSFKAGVCPSSFCFKK
jgi:hypothetical protein